MNILHKKIDSTNRDFFVSSGAEGLRKGFFPPNNDDGRDVQDIGRADDLRIGQPRQQNAAGNSEGQHIAHKVGAESGMDLHIELFRPDQHLGIQDFLYLTKEQDSLPYRCSPSQRDQGKGCASSGYSACVP